MVDDLLPPNAHEVCSGRLHLSLSRLQWEKSNLVVKHFPTRQDLKDALMASAFVPVFFGLLPPRYDGERVMDGGMSANIVKLDEHTITVCPFSGDFDVCPSDDIERFDQVDALGMGVEMSITNLRRVGNIMHPPTPAGMQELARQGFDDTLYFLMRRGIVKCPLHKSVRVERDESEEEDDEEVTDGEQHEEEKKQSEEQQRRVRSLYELYSRFTSFLSREGKKEARLNKAQKRQSRHARREWRERMRREQEERDRQEREAQARRDRREKMRAGRRREEERREMWRDEALRRKRERRVTLQVDNQDLPSSNKELRVVDVLNEQEGPVSDSEVPTDRQPGTSDAEREARDQAKALPKLKRTVTVGPLRSVDLAAAAASTSGSRLRKVKTMPALRRRGRGAAPAWLLAKVGIRRRRWRRTCKPAEMNVYVDQCEECLDHVRLACNGGFSDVVLEEFAKAQGVYDDAMFRHRSLLERLGVADWRVARFFPVRLAIGCARLWLKTIWHPVELAKQAVNYLLSWCTRLRSWLLSEAPASDVKFTVQFIAAGIAFFIRRLREGPKVLEEDSKAARTYREIVERGNFVVEGVKSVSHSLVCGLCVVSNLMHAGAELLFKRHKYTHVKTNYMVIFKEPKHPSSGMQGKRRTTLSAEPEARASSPGSSEASGRCPQFYLSEDDDVDDDDDDIVDEEEVLDWAWLEDTDWVNLAADDEEEEVRDDDAGFVTSVLGAQVGTFLGDATQPLKTSS